MFTPERLSQIREAILAYLESHPDAADTEQGIACWWLPAELRGDRSQVALALAELVQQGRVGLQVNRDRHAIYSSPLKPMRRERL